jgi:hypothetical protein
MSKVSGGARAELIVQIAAALPVASIPETRPGREVPDRRVALTTYVQRMRFAARASHVEAAYA